MPKIRIHDHNRIRPSRKTHTLDLNPSLQTYQVDELSCTPDLISGEPLDAGGRTVCTGTYVVTQDDIDSGKVSGVTGLHLSPLNLRQLRVPVSCQFALSVIYTGNASPILAPFARRRICPFVLPIERTNAGR